MNLKKTHLNTTIGLFLVGAFLLLGSSMVYAGDACQIIRIEKGKGAGGTRIEIFPEKITVPVGTCTVWINFVERKEVQVSFKEDAKACIMSTDAATGFDEQQLKEGETCYISQRLPRGKTASLVWSKPGIFEYQLETPGSAPGQTQGYPGAVVAEGVIEVK